MLIPNEMEQIKKLPGAKSGEYFFFGGGGDAEVLLYRSLLRNP
jgi:hypothetical protein